MNTIWKYTLSPQNTQVEMPRGSRVLTVAGQNDEICLWAQVDTEAPKHVRKYVIVGTGHSIPEGDMRYVGTAHLYTGQLVLHIFERL